MPTASIPGNRTRDSHLRAEGFFDAAEHPQVRFRSTLVNELDGSIAVNGDLEAARREIPVALEATVR